MITVIVDMLRHIQDIFDKLQNSIEKLNKRRSYKALHFLIEKNLKAAR